MGRPHQQQIPQQRKQEASAAATTTEVTHLTSLGKTKHPTSSSSSPQRPPLCRFFVLHRGNCRYGDDECAYSHELPDGVVSWEQAAKELVPCPFFARGDCKYGEYCQLRHDENDIDNDNDEVTDAEPRGDLMMKTCKPCAEVPSPTSTANTAVPADTSDTTTATHSADEEVTTTIITCGICLDDLQGGESTNSNRNKTKNKKQFGLLSCCDHAFCFDCLMEWRKEGTQEAKDRRSCPTCRKHSDYVVPSRIFPSSKLQKERIVQEYKDRLAVIPCRRFRQQQQQQQQSNNNKRTMMGSCPFGSDCFYAHLNSRGEDVKALDRSMEELSRERQQAQEERRRRRQRDLLMMGLEASTVEDIDIMLSFLRLLDVYGIQEGVYPWSDDDGDDHEEEGEDDDDISDYDYGEYEESGFYSADVLYQMYRRYENEEERVEASPDANDDLEIVD